MLLLGLDIVPTPLKRIINNSIENRVYPEEWKKMVVTPILKKGDQRDNNNNRPLSCLAMASKVLKKIICEQITKHMDSNSLLPTTKYPLQLQRKEIDNDRNIRNTA